ncbi:MAG: 50S ribosomal protein L35 [Candidatus Wildermuthbacteria bacterium RIFCSPHIGHO2_01_FULL_48_25]|uniref:Large ribosomal subunit protein bL35 n=1 Tax=Candidatus Wildermuthbacteria bacterium RIFCSPLOWO2_01_FULL_48_16 TaxID=1802461 RepID=A0A1G2RJM6_9BACT|nr:MAG: 50S ribosomal protein L35 [Candidatus Wildermuthbacteria bacterium RIFCSPHIGHO2_01_FULL_48_25]OHA68423.1 MAG: 50S ribosomal protein L35 [Candidatus Wildermuthbacteria bacterium RIFCSPHIGHO2_02_FULL_49_12b]OHA73040.1 MAG: 50S ribosomal protein L35 [Candidatus Wildermuthbacteria bacterium RIFCSPLOWO2_01_FULL_48_16]
MKLKTRKSISKRFKITKNGKVLRRPVGQDHGLAKETGKKIRKLRRWIEISGPEAKAIKHMLKF